MSKRKTTFIVEAQPTAEYSVEDAAKFLRSKLSRKVFGEFDLTTLDDDMYCDEINGMATCYFKVTPMDGEKEFPIVWKHYLTNLLDKSGMFESVTVRGKLNRIVFKNVFEHYTDEQKARFNAEDRAHCEAARRWI